MPFSEGSLSCTVSFEGVRGEILRWEHLVVLSPSNVIVDHIWAGEEVEVERGLFQIVVEKGDALTIVMVHKVVQEVHISKWLDLGFHLAQQLWIIVLLIFIEHDEICGVKNVFEWVFKALKLPCCLHSLWDGYPLPCFLLRLRYKLKSIDAAASIVISLLGKLSYYLIIHLNILLLDYISETWNKSLGVRLLDLNSQSNLSERGERFCIHVVAYKDNGPSEWDYISVLLLLFCLLFTLLWTCRRFIVLILFLLVILHILIIIFIGFALRLSLRLIIDAFLEILDNLSDTARVRTFEGASQGPVNFIHNEADWLRSGVIISWLGRFFLGEIIIRGNGAFNFVQDLLACALIWSVNLQRFIATVPGKHFRHGGFASAGRAVKEDHPFVFIRILLLLILEEGLSTWVGRQI